MAGVIRSPITNFIDLADIDKAAYQARAAEQQYQLRDLQMKDAVRKQQEQSQLRDLIARNTTEATPGSPAVPFVTTEEAEFGLPNLRGNYSQEAVAPTKGGMNRDAIVTGAYKINPALGIELEGKFSDLNSKKAKMSSEQLEFLIKAAPIPEMWPQVRELAPPDVRKHLPEEWSKDFADLITKTSLTEYQKQDLAIKRQNANTAAARASRLQNKATPLQEKIGLIDLMVELDEMSPAEGVQRKKGLVTSGASQGFSEMNSARSVYSMKYRDMLGNIKQDAPPFEQWLATEWPTIKGGVSQQPPTQPLPPAQQPLAPKERSKYSSLWGD